MNFNNDAEKSTFDKIVNELPNIIKTKCNNYDELYGHRLIKDQDDEDSIRNQYYNESIAHALIYKLCKAYQFQYHEIVKHIIAILKWRHDFNPLSAAFKEVHDPELQHVGILTRYLEGKNDGNKKVVTWNLYGQLVKKKHVFKDISKFLRYRVGLMERGLKLLDFNNENNCYMTQVHDYKGVSMWKMDPEIKKCTKLTIRTFQNYYPELLYAKYFVNVPKVLSWVYDLVKTFVDERTRRKFVVLNDGTKLGEYLPECPSLEYGGQDKKRTLMEQNVKVVTPTPYGLFLLEQQNKEDID
ncbi:Sfh5p NDAI_0G06260 [Naumovozyma dairenensis CBS 421]|uniref:Phosphatidylinositol transfer protein SFH5 n=1 Tax=Naumovozyma dairenensis (strain ATCC 10597 / BCRC 20456 / CBS 421 / NBRC 0211 / NRRL Y-12639) TaxID=1071378 RepID=J7RER5_NAUDC|nr:hypothetical protein NDAI_0G06260 [Naumovozyma dairenensis CBS 421]CCK73609.1 hypothetical protein NDAI_0G06260 [Naumovozyma dairenensis CBS 421]